MKNRFWIFKVVFCLMLFGSILRINVNALDKAKTSISQSTIKNQVECSVVKERNPYIITKDNLRNFDINIVYKSNLVVRGTVIDKKELELKLMPKAYKNKHISEKCFRELITLRVSYIEKSDKSNNKIKVGSIIKVLNESCSNHWVEGTIKLDKSREYILFLSKIKNTANIKFSKYAQYVVNAPTWASILISNGKYYVDEIFKEFCDYQETEKKRRLRKEGSFSRTYFISSTFEGHLAGYYQNELRNNADVFNKPLNLSNIRIEQIQTISMYNFMGRSRLVDDTKDKEKIIELLKSLNVTGNEMYSRTGPPISVNIIYKSGNKMSSESFGIADIVISHFARDNNKKLLNFGYYTISNRILDQLQIIFDSDMVATYNICKEILSNNPDGDIFDFNKVVYIKSETKDDSIELGERVGYIKKRSSDYRLDNWSATKLPVWTNIYRPNGAKDNSVLLVKSEGNIIEYIPYKGSVTVLTK